MLYLYREASPAESPSSRHSLPQGSERRRPCGRPYRKGARWHGHRIHRHRIRRPGPPRSLDRTTSPTLSHTKYSSLCSLCASFSDLCVKPLHRAPSRISPKQRGVNDERFRRQTIHVCAPGVSISTLRTPFASSHARSFRFNSIRRSSTPQAIHRSFNSSFAFAFNLGKSLSSSSGKPPELNAPIHANLSTLFKPVSSDSLPPMESPAIAREFLSLL